MLFFDNFPYVNVPDFSGDIKSDVGRLLCANGKEKTFGHVCAVAETNMRIAERYGLDPSVCAAGGYLHDISAVIKPVDMLRYARENGMYIDEAEQKYPFLLHQRMSGLVAEQKPLRCSPMQPGLVTENIFGITDERILSAVGCHSTLNAHPSAYDMALYIADKLSWDGEGTPPWYDIVSKALQTSLEAAALAHMDYIVDNKMILMPHKWFIEAMIFLRNA